MTQTSTKKATPSPRAAGAPSGSRRAKSTRGPLSKAVSTAREKDHTELPTRATAGNRSRASRKQANLLVRFDSSGKALIRRAAAVRGLNVSDYVRTRILPLARQDVEEAESGVLRLSREDQIAFWQALQNPPPPTEAQRRLGELIRSVM